MSDIILSRKARQLNKFYEAVYEGKLQVTLLVYPTEARYWVKRGGIFCNMDTVKVIDEKSKLGYYTFTFNHSHLLESPLVLNYIAEGDPFKCPFKVNFGEYLYLIAQQLLEKSKK